MSGAENFPEDVRQKLVALAQQAHLKAYAPYSRYSVGAAVLTGAGHFYTGCNVENISYGLSSCAERNAIFQAVTTEGANMRLRAVAVANFSGTDCTPCGACRQVVAEFGSETLVICRLGGEWVKKSISVLLPGVFTIL